MDALIGQSRAERRRLEEEAKAAAEGLIENEEEEEEDVDSLIDWPASCASTSTKGSGHGQV